MLGLNSSCRLIVRLAALYAGLAASVASGAAADSSASADRCALEILSGQRDQNWIYRVSYQGMGAEATRQLTLTESGDWVLAQSMSILIVSLNEQSRATLNQGQLSTLDYRKEQKGIGAKTTEIRVDSESKQVIASYKGKSQNYSVNGSVVDPLLQTLQIQLDRQCSAAAGVNTRTSVVYPVLGRSGVTPYSFSYIAEETTHTPWGELTAERWQREADGVRDTLWLAPSKNHALVRVEHEEKGELSSLQLKEVK